MAQIPIYEGGMVDVRAAPAIEGNATPEQMGAGIGRAMQQAGNQLMSLSVDFKREKDKQETLLRGERVAQEVASGSIRLSEINADAQVKAPPDGAGVKDGVYKSQLEAIEKQAAEIADPVARSQFKIKMLGDLSAYAQNNVKFELDRSVANTTEKSNFALNGLENAIRGNASMYDKHMAEGLAVIDAQQVPDGQKENMKREWVQRVAHARFQGLITNAKSPEDYDAITKELQQDQWQNAFKPEEYTSVLRDIEQSKKVFTTQAATQARAVLDGIESRLENGVEVDPSELSQASVMAENSYDPIILKRALRAQRDAQIIEKGKKMTAAQLETEANARLGEGYPNMSPTLQDAAEKAHGVFPGISPGFFGALTNMEYGVYLKGSPAKGDPKFAPRAVGARVDLTGLRPRTSNALSIAGQIYGAPLPLVSAYRSQARQDSIRFGRGNPNRMSVAEHSHHTSGTAVDISTAGMAGAEKGKLVDALLQAGFTGFGEYGTHIHADMRAKTTNSFNPRTGFLGWSKGSPEVVAAMVKRGYRAGADASTIQRGGAGVQIDATDYGLGTQNGSTSAIGVNQWTEKAFIDVMRDPKIAARVGLPPNLTDAQLLELRKDPNWSFMATGAYAEQNKSFLENSLGRPVNDAELYMAHFLGPGGAQTLISAYKQNPDANAAELMPQAAKNNPGKFFVKGKPMTVRDVYDNIAVQFSTAPSQVTFEDAQTYQRQATSQRKREQTDPMTLYGQNVVDVNDLQSQGGFTARGAVATAASDYYSIPRSEMKPFTTDEATEFAKTIADGSVEQKLSLLGNINEMDKAAPGMGQAAMTQINQKDTAYAYAGAVLSERDDLPTAEMIVRGADRLKQDKTLGESLFASKEAYTAFTKATGGVLNSIAPASRSAIFDAAKAYYAEKMAQQGKFEFDAKEFQAAAIKVAAGSEDAIGDVNGTPTMLPPGVSEETFNTAVDNLTDEDLVKLGADATPPIDITGTPVPAQDIAKEGAFVYIGGTSYKIRMLDGNFLVTGDTDGKGRLAVYVFNADPKAINDIAARPPETYISPEEEERILKQWKYVKPADLLPGRPRVTPPEAGM